MDRLEDSLIEILRERKIDHSMMSMPENIGDPGFSNPLQMTKNDEEEEKKKNEGKRKWEAKQRYR